MSAPSEPGTRLLLNSPAVPDADIIFVIDFVYGRVLKRKPDAHGLLYHYQALRSGLDVIHFINGMIESDEAREKSCRGLSFDDASSIVAFVYERHAGRKGSERDIEPYVAALTTDASADASAGGTEAGEPVASSGLSEQDVAFLINFAYEKCLHRPADPGGLANYSSAFRAGIPIRQIFQEIDGSTEAALRRAEDARLDDLSDGEFVLAISDALLNGGGIVPRDLEGLKTFLSEDSERRKELVQRLVAQHVERQQEDSSIEIDPDRCWIMGTDRYLTRDDWNERVKELGLDGPRQSGSGLPPVAERSFKHTGEYVVSAIASLYRGGKYLEAFLDNITSQTIFDRSELIIIDADSPEGEHELISEYQKVYPNIVYKRMNYRIGIYDAWNVGVELSRGRYLTNTNLDDLRRNDSFELQARALDEFAYADIAYQDFLYSFDHAFSFEDVERCGFRSDLPIITTNNLIAYNSPHNAPVWRRTLHDELGLFDTTLKSAGDAEFWLRCRVAGKEFHKINTPHVVYFQNPEGLSTRADSRGMIESRRNMQKYCRKLTSPYLTMSRTKFAEEVGVSPDGLVGVPHYSIAHDALRLLGKKRMAALHATPAASGVGRVGES